MAVPRRKRRSIVARKCSATDRFIIGSVGSSLMPRRRLRTLRECAPDAPYYMFPQLSCTDAQEYLALDVFDVLWQSLGLLSLDLCELRRVSGSDQA